MKRVIPLLDRILLQRVKAQEKTASGILIPEKAQETLNEAIVIQVGSGVKDSIIKKGDRVLLPPFGGNQVKVGNEEFLLMKDSEILAKLE